MSRRLPGDPSSLRRWLVASMRGFRSAHLQQQRSRELQPLHHFNRNAGTDGARRDYGEADDSPALASKLGNNGALQLLLHCSCCRILETRTVRSGQMDCIRISVYIVVIQDRLHTT